MPLRIEREKTQNTPKVLFDGEKGYLYMQGECYLENVLDFFHEINDCLKSYLTADFTSFTFDCHLSYYNSSTTKQLYKMFALLNKFSGEDKKITVNWIYDSNDDSSLEDGEDFKDGFDHLIFNLVGN